MADINGNAFVKIFVHSHAAISIMYNEDNERINFGLMYLHTLVPHAFLPPTLVAAVFLLVSDNRYTCNNARALLACGFKLASPTVVIVAGERLVW